jgi:2',3'-cyclic-nucleotide 2'-phosphodiesterase (5'-nucleotidase family)
VKDAGRVKIGYIGVDTADLAVRVMPTNLVDGRRTVTIDDTLVKAAIAEARAQGAQIVVALLHRGWNANENGVAITSAVRAGSGCADGRRGVRSDRPAARSWPSRAAP